MDFTGKPVAAPPHWTRSDLDRMPDTPTRRAHHRRAHSETFFRFPHDNLLDDDDILLDDVVADFDLASLDITPPLSSMAAADDSSKSKTNKRSSPGAGPAPSHHLRSLSVGADFFEGLEFGDSGKPPTPTGGQQQQQRYHHRHSNSMDGSTSFEAEESSEMMLMDGMKKAMGPDRLAELALLDPKRAKRILANRQSAARSKERKIRYTNELERKVHTLQSEATTLSAQVTMLQRDTTGLTTENKELKLRLQAMEQQAHLRDALNEALREEVQRLKIATGQIPAANGNPFGRGLPPQFPSQPQMFQHFNNNQAQPAQHQQQLHMSQSTTNHQTQSAQPQPSFSDFN
ncbi:transcription factor VIP1 [Rhododendron vialii]|uniref:transcription factor VIP1 n=1 Tax=Rhododendron vialii TaxID=182163 RepID=UPI00265F0123|nr:transcription factor VIP1 [Rhododendron vialii]